MSKDMLKGPGHTQATFYEIESYGVRDYFGYFLEVRCKEIEDARKYLNDLKSVCRRGTFRIMKVTRQVTERREVVE